MELRQLKAFVKVAETLSFSQASKKLYITQSALSQSIRKLEEELDSPLFMRDNHGVALTEAGQTLLPHAKKTIEESENCLCKLNELAGLKRGTLNIGITHSYRIISSDTINKFIKAYPGINFNIYYKSSEELMKMLEDKVVDIVLSYKTSDEYPLVESHNLFEDRLCAVMSCRHPLAKKEKVTLAELEHYTLVLPAEGMQARNLFDKIAERYSFHKKPRIVINEVTPLLSLVAIGTAVTILSSQSALTRQDTVAIPLDVEGADMNGCFHILKDSYLKASVREFIQMLCETHLLNLKMQSILAGDTKHKL